MGQTGVTKAKNNEFEPFMTYCSKHARSQGEAVQSEEDQSKTSDIFGITYPMEFFEWYPWILSFDKTKKGNQFKLYESEIVFHP